MSVEDRLLLNRLILTGQHQIQLMLLCNPNKLDRVLTTSRQLGGASITYIDRKVGYVRLELPIKCLARLIANRSIDAYHIASLARGSSARDALPRQSAEGSHAAQEAPTLRLPSSTPDVSLPILTPTAAQRPGYTADEGMGIERWLREHPTFDGRGVTIAFIESAQPEFSHPTFGPAKTLDGRPVDKIADIINALDPTEYDQTRVALTTKLEAGSTWVQIGNRTFILPRAGKYLFGFLLLNAGDNLIQQVGVLRSQTTGEIWVDTDGDSDFRNEQAVLGVRRKFEVRSLKITKPVKTEVKFVVTEGNTPTMVHVYLSIGSHQAMTVSVAAGSRNSGLAYGVAPAARVVLVRGATSELRLSDFIESNLAAAARRDVDILTTSFATGLLPDTEADFVGLLFRRLVHAYNKPVFKSAGNAEQLLSSASATGDAFSVGGTISPATYEAFYGGAPLTDILIHPQSSAGPARDGALKPDFLAPEERISAATCTRNTGTPLPKNQPTRWLPPCYWISGNTSASSPYAAGIAALLISAAKQMRIDYSVANLGRSLRASARFLPNAPAYKQGAGLLDVEGAWRELQRGVTNPRITLTGENHQVVTTYSARGSKGPGLLDEEGWTVTSRGVRTLLLRRDAGPSVPTAYRLSWTGNDGTFSAAPSVVLPLRETVALTVSIAPRTATVHSAILNVHEPATDAIVLRSMVTIVVPERLESPAYATRFEGRVSLVQSASHFWNVPAHTDAISLEFTVKRGTLRAILTPSIDSQYAHKYPPSLRRTLGNGTYHFVIADPSPGVWSVTVTNDSSIREQKRELISTEEAQYDFKVQALGTSLTASNSDGKPTLVVTNRGGQLDEPTIKESWGTLTSHESNFDPDGVADSFEIQVPPKSSSLIVNARMNGELKNPAAVKRGLDLYLYDCITGECFSHDFALPASSEQRLVVRNPSPGRWVARVGGPSFPSAGSFTIDAIAVATKGSKTTKLGHVLARDEVLTVSLAPSGSAPFNNAVRVYELFDGQVEQVEAQQPWVETSDLKKLTGRPTALGILVSELKD